MSETRERWVAAARQRQEPIEGVRCAAVTDDPEWGNRCTIVLTTSRKVEEPWFCFKHAALVKASGLSIGS